MGNFAFRTIFSFSPTAMSLIQEPRLCLDLNLYGHKFHVAVEPHLAIISNLRVPAYHRVEYEYFFDQVY